MPKFTKSVDLIKNKKRIANEVEKTILYVEIVRVLSRV